MADILTSLTALAVSAFRSRSEAVSKFPDWYGGIFSPDPVLQEAHRASIISPDNQAMKAIGELIMAEPDFAIIAPREGELDPMVLSAQGGIRTSLDGLITSLLTSALLQMYFLRSPYEEGTFVRIVLEGFEELRRAVRGERVRAYDITAIARISLPEGAQISTPWGLIRPAPPATSIDPRSIMLGQLKTSCILAEPRLIRVKFDRSASPQLSFDAADAAPTRSRNLFPLACALASNDNMNPVAPIMSWFTYLLPFQSGLGFTLPVLPHVFGGEVDVGGQISQIEEWARIVDRAHVESVEIAAHRLVSAVGHRMDRSDALIDAVMVWENLLGTRIETAFRVTAALSKLLEPDLIKRRELHSTLKRIYDIRSRVVHGDQTTDKTKIDQACGEAVDFAIRALGASYQKGPSWLALTSEKRADQILLEWA